MVLFALHAWEIIFCFMSIHPINATCIPPGIVHSVINKMATSLPRSVDDLFKKLEAVFSEKK